MTWRSEFNDGRSWGRKDRSTMTAANFAQPQQVAVIATQASWMYGGEPVTVGERYTLNIGDAQRLIAVGKAKAS